MDWRRSRVLFLPADVNVPQDPFKVQWILLIVFTVDAWSKSVGLYYTTKTVWTTTSKMIILHSVGNMITQECLEGICSNLAEMFTWTGLMNWWDLGWSRKCHKNGLASWCVKPVLREFLKILTSCNLDSKMNWLDIFGVKGPVDLLRVWKKMHIDWNCSGCRDNHRVVILVFIQNQ